MPISVICECGSSYLLKDEFAGRMLTCNACGRALRAIPTASVATQPQADPVFDRDRFLLRQKVLTINQKYHVSDEQGRPICFVVRRTFPLRTVLAALAFIVTWAAVIGGTIAAAMAIDRSLMDREENAAAIIGVAALVGLIAAIAVAIVSSPKRHVVFYRDENQSEKLLEVLQDRKFQPIVATYTVCDTSGQVIAHFRKNYLYNFLRKRWDVLTHDKSQLLCQAMEDSIILSLLRRFLGPMLGLLRTNFIITTPDRERVIGEFNRKFTILDRYVLDLTSDPQRQFDRRVALALGVMLDTGEKR